MTNGYVPVAVGVPLIIVVDAVEVPRVRPVGSVPDATVHAKGPVAVPVATIVTVYGTVTVPFGNVGGIMLSVDDGLVNEKVTVQVAFPVKLPPQLVEVAIVYPEAVVVAVTA